MASSVFQGVKTLLSLLCATFFTYIFVFSGLVVSLLSILLLPVWPVSKTAYRYITSWLAYTVLGQIVWVCVDYADLRVHYFGTRETYDLMGKESQIITSSHRGDLDWVAGFVMGAQLGFLHSIRSLPKRSIRYVPGFGQLLWALEYPFLARNNYQKDKKTIAEITKAYKTYPFPIQVAIYCEGTRFTKEKHAKGVEYAKKHDLPPLKHHITPRTKGFALLAEHLREGADFKSVFDVAVAYPGHMDSIFTHLDMLMGRRVDIYWYMRHIPIEELPKTHDELNTFCYQMFQHKDEAYQHFLDKGEFPAPRQTLSLSQRVLWQLRAIAFCWVLLLTVFPLLFLYLTCPWHVISTVLTVSGLLNLVLFIGLILYGRGAQLKDGQEEASQHESDQTQEPESPQNSSAQSKTPQDHINKSGKQD